MPGNVREETIQNNNNSEKAINITDALRDSEKGYAPKYRYFIELSTGVILISFATKWFYDFFVDLLFSRDPLLLWNHWYYQRYREHALEIYAIGHWLTSSYWTIVLLILLLTLIWRIRTDLSKSGYCWLNRGMLVVFLSIGLVLYFGVIRLSMLPLLPIYLN